MIFSKKMDEAPQLTRAWTGQPLTIVEVIFSKEIDEAPQIARAPSPRLVTILPRESFAQELANHRRQTSRLLDTTKRDLARDGLSIHHFIATQVRERLYTTQSHCSCLTPGPENQRTCDSYGSSPTILPINPSVILLRRFSCRSV